MLRAAGGGGAIIGLTTFGKFVVLALGLSAFWTGFWDFLWNRFPTPTPVPLIATVSDLEKIANDDNADSPALTGWRYDAFGADALKLKRGELALVLDGTRVRVVEVRRAPKA